MREFIQKYSLAIVLGIFGLAGFSLIWFNTPWGIGVGYDSIFYLSAADNLLSGLGLSRLDGYGNLIPLTHFPPFYSITIAGLSFIGGFESDVAARILASFFFAFLVGLSGWIIYRYTRSLLACTLGAALIMVSPVLLDVSFMAMSELPFLVLLLLMIHYLNNYLMDGKKAELIICAVLAALMYLTRYVGLTAVAMGGLSLLLYRDRSWGKKANDLIIFGLISLIPVLIFYARNWYLTGSMTNRIIGFHPPSVNQIKQGLATISTWLLPARINPSLRLVVLGLLLITVLTLIAFSYLKDRKSNNNQTVDKAAKQFVLLMVLYAVIYLVMLVLSLTFFDASTKLNDRILSPVYLVGILVCLITVWNISWFEDHVIVRYGIVALILVFIGMNFLRSFDISGMMRNKGKGFSGKEWRTSETVAALAQLPPDTLLFSNEAFAIYYLTGIPANWIPENYDPVKNQADDNYSQRVDLMLDEIVSQDGALIVFNSISNHNVYAPVEELSKGLSLLIKSKDGAIFVSP
jgi:hypothetical protein